MAGPVTAVYWLRRAAALAGDEKTGNAVGTILTAFLLPFILIIVCLCGMMDAAADHNRAAVEWCFGDGAIPAAVPEEYAGHITQMRACFAVLDGAVGKLNAELEEGSVPLRANRVKADFFALNFGAPDLTLRQGQAESFAGCYVSEAVRIRTVEVPNPEYDPPENEEELEDYDVPKTIEVEQEYMVTVPEKDMAVVYARLHALQWADGIARLQENGKATGALTWPRRKERRSARRQMGPFCWRGTAMRVMGTMWWSVMAAALQRCTHIALH